MILAPIIERYRENIQAVYVSQTLLDLSYFRKRLSFFVRNYYPFCISPGDLFRFVKWNFRGIEMAEGRVVDWVRRQGVQADYIGDINSKTVLEKLRAHNGDVFVFIPFDKVAKDEFLAIPRLGVFNVHLGKLPEYRGGFSAFWVLRCKDVEAGATLHRAVRKIDGGEIVAETRFPVSTNSMKELMDETVRQAALMVSQNLEQILEERIKPISTEGRDENYYMLPTADDFRAFYAAGNRLI